MESNPNFERMTVVDIVEWLQEQGIPTEFCDAFSGTSDFQFSPSGGYFDFSFMQITT